MQYATASKREEHQWKYVKKYTHIATFSLDLKSNKYSSFRSYEFLWIKWSLQCVYDNLFFLGNSSLHFGLFIIHKFADPSLIMTTSVHANNSYSNQKILVIQKFSRFLHSFSRLPSISQFVSVRCSGDNSLLFLYLTSLIIIILFI